MNLYFLVEDKRAGKKVYKAWLGHVFPRLTAVQAIDQVVENHYFIISGQGYPAYRNRILNALDDINNHGGIDHFFLCIDTENETPEDKLAEIQELLAQAAPFEHIHIILHNCCIETWFLGHTKMLKTNPQSETLRRYKRHCDVSVTDPESCGCPEDYDIRAQFHYDYLQEMLREQHLVYTKYTAGPVADKVYFDALQDRYNTTGHIASFGKLIETWAQLSEQISHEQ